jgi:hypothetical protein
MISYDGDRAKTPTVPPQGHHARPAPIVFTGAYGGVTSAVTYDTAVAQVNASLTFQLPAGATLTAASGTQYPVTYSGSNPGNSVDAPLPLWAMVALGCALLVLSLRRQSGRG